MADNLEEDKNDKVSESATMKLLMLIIGNQLKQETMLLVLMDEQAKVNCSLNPKLKLEDEINRLHGEIKSKMIPATIALAQNFAKIAPGSKDLMEGFISDLFE